VNGLPQMIDAKHLPIVLPEVEKYLPTEDGQPPLGNATTWAWDRVQCSVVSNQLIDNETIFPLELNTMPGWAGSSWYWMRYMDAHNENEFASADALKYWENVDLYIGGSEHATGHLLYSRFWNKFLKDRGYAPTEEPFKKLINQGMILGMSAFFHRVEKILIYEKKSELNPSQKYDPILGEYVKDIYPIKNDLISYSCSDFKKYVESKGLNPRENFEYDLQEEYSDFLIDNLTDSIDSLDTIFFNKSKYAISIFTSPRQLNIDNINDITNEVDLDKFNSSSLYSEYKNVKKICDLNGKFIASREVEKMSKSKYNVVNPDDICNDYGADTLRLYEMFLGPLEQAKPWNTAGITGVSGFLKKLWRLYFDDNGSIVTNDEPTADMYKSLHKTIKKVTEDIENFSFNTSVSQFMICVNELATMKCNHRAILEPLAILVSPYAPHIAEELWSQLGHEGSVSTVAFPLCEEKYLVESEKEYPVSFNGKMRFTIKLPLDLTKDQIQEIIMADERTIAQLAGNTPKNIIIVPGKIINLVG
jgi:leucyl-tRNA synthetase